MSIQVLANYLEFCNDKNLEPTWWGLNNYKRIIWERR